MNPNPSTPHIPAAYPWWLSLILFVGCYALLQWGWESARGGRFEQIVVHDATVGTAAAIVRTLTPEIDAQAVGTRIQAEGGGLNVLKGCEGTEVLFLLWSALLAHPLRWRTRLAGLLLGTPLIFVLNEIRLVGLFYSFRSHRELFDQLHGLVTPAVLVALTVVFYLALLRWNDRLAQGDHAAALEQGAAR